MKNPAIVDPRYRPECGSAPPSAPVPTMYDISLDEERPATQADIDALLQSIRIMARHRAAAAILEQMCRDACTGALPVKEYYRITGTLSHSYTSAEAQQRLADEVRGRAVRRQEERDSTKENA